VATGADNKIYGAGARIFVGAVQRSTIDILDVPDLANPLGASVTAHLGCPYVCPDFPKLPECAGCPFLPPSL